jgi:hypothetical protein
MEAFHDMRGGTVIRPARWRLVAIAGGLALLTVACGSSSTTSPSTPSPAAPSPSAPAAVGSSPSSALCADAAALFASLNQLTHIQVHKGMKDEITAKLTTVKANLTAFVTEARGRWQAQTAVLKSALTNVQTAAKSLTANPSVSAAGGVLSALGGVGAATQNLRVAVSRGCPSASPSPSG